VTLSVRLLGIELAVERDGRIHDLIGPVTKECRHNAEICLMLASETTVIYAKRR
jgi:hypothetical protein